MASLSRLFFFLFFFSSRRRHTRCSRDWSSDVCSSDLVSPDGRRVAYVRDDGKGTSMLRVLDAATGRPLAAHRVNGGVDYDWLGEDRKSTRLNSSHGYISYAVFCLKKKKNSIATPDLHRHADYTTCLLR